MYLLKYGVVGPFNGFSHNFRENLLMSLYVFQSL